MRLRAYIPKRIHWLQERVSLNNLVAHNILIFLEMKQLSINKENQKFFNEQIIEHRWKILEKKGSIERKYKKKLKKISINGCEQVKEERYNKQQIMCIFQIKLQQELRKMIPVWNQKTEENCDWKQNIDLVIGYSSPLYYFVDELIKILIIKIYNLLQYPMIYKQARALCLLFIFVLCRQSYQFTFQTHSFSQPKACAQPQIVQYLKNYHIQTNDLQNLISTSINSFTVAGISSKKVTFSETKCNIKYLGGQVIKQITPTQYSITNDTFSVNLGWQANVSKTVGHNSYNTTAQIAGVKVSYTKSYNLQLNQFQVTNTTYSFTADMIEVKTYAPSPSATEKTQIEAVVKNELFNAISQQFKSLGSWMNDNAKKQRIASVYPNDTYQYDFYKWILSIDTKTKTLTSTGNDYIHGYSGEVVGQTEQFCPLSIPSIRPQYNQFISMEFIQNFARAVVDRYSNYKNVLINQSWVRTENFQFKLVDLEYVLTGVYEKYGQYYMKPVTFTCGTKQLVSGFITNNKLTQIIQWSCLGYVWTNNSTSVQIIDSQLTVQHGFQIFLNSDTLSVYDNVITIVDAKFNPVGTITVKDKDLALLYISEFLNDMRTYVPGTWFKLKTGTTKISFQADANIGAGLWVG